MSAPYKDRLGANVALDYDEHRIHSGRYFTGNAYDPAVLIATPLEVLLVPVARETHSMIIATINGKGSLEFFEDTTVSADGTPVTLFNRNRTLPDRDRLVQIKAYSGPTVTADGTRLKIDIGADERQPKWILYAGRNYLLRVTVAKDSTTVDVELNFEEYPS